MVDDYLDAEGFDDQSVDGPLYQECESCGAKFGMRKVRELRNNLDEISAEEWACTECGEVLIDEY